MAAPSPFGPEQYRLVDRTTGKFEPLPVPESERWGLLAVSPWRDSEGNLEAVGRWVTRPDAKGNGEFCGVGIFRLSDATVKERISMDKLPTGRPCWVPGQPGDFLFPVGDGLLYRWRASGGIGSAAGATPGERGSRTADGTPELRAVKWECTPPGAGLPILDDPVWSSEPALKRFVLVALSLQKSVGTKKVHAPYKLWWLEMNAHGDAIVAAGPLTGPADAESQTGPMTERLPNLAATGDRIGLVYLRREPGRLGWNLCAGRLEIDPATGRPQIDATTLPPRVLAQGLAFSPLLFSPDGQTVYAAHPSREIVGYAIRGQSAAIAAPGA